MALLAGIILTASATHAPSIRLDRSTPAWGRVTREIRAQGVGNCYHAAVTLAMNARSLGLENVVGRAGHPDGRRVRSKAIGSVTPGWRPTFPASPSESSSTSPAEPRSSWIAHTYRFAQQAQDVHEYSVSQARTLASNGDYGPWTADVLAAWHA